MGRRHPLEKSPNETLMPLVVDFPHVSRVARIRRDGYDADGQLISKEIVHAVTSLDAQQASAAGLAKIARGQWGIENC